MMISPVCLETLEDLARGLRTKEIARVRGKPLKTVQHRREYLFRKLGVHTGAQAVALAFRQGWLR